jgi:acyl-CoA thioester hydrolase
VAGTLIYRTAVQADWIDYNGHMRDAYYAVAVSLAVDALMDAVGLDAAYRERTRNTLYSLEMHLSWLREVKAAATLEVVAHLLGLDAKRLHLGLDIKVAGEDAAAATAELMLLHVHQGAKPGAAPFEPAIAARLAALAPAPGAAPWAGPGSRALTLAKRAAT